MSGQQWQSVDGGVEPHPFGGVAARLTVVTRGGRLIGVMCVVDAYEGRYFGMILDRLVREIEKHAAVEGEVIV